MQFYLYVLVYMCRENKEEEAMKMKKETATATATQINTFSNFLGKYTTGAIRREYLWF